MSITGTDRGSEYDPVVEAPRRSNATWIVVAVLAVVVVVAVVFAVRLSSGAPASGTAVLGKPMPTMELTTLDGKQLTNADLTGRSVMVNFWNTWCLPCEQEAPALATFAEPLQNTPGTLLLAVVRADSEDAVRNNVDRAPKGWTVVFDKDQQAALGFGTRGQPETYAVDPSGTVRSSKYGPASVAELQAMYSAAGGAAQ